MKNTGHRGGFTLAELLVVVAIIAVLVGIAIPVFSAQLEKSRQAVDMATARQIAGLIAVAYNTGEIQIPAGNNSHGYGVWVMLCRGDDASSMPQPYQNKNVKGMWCGANKGVSVSGKTYNSDWDYNKELEKLLSDAGFDIYKLRVHAGGKDADPNGWDWIIIQVGYGADQKLFTRIYSGFGGENGGLTVTPRSNIEKKIAGEL